jgi:hypothetical protein
MRSTSTSASQVRELVEDEQLADDEGDIEVMYYSVESLHSLYFLVLYFKIYSSVLYIPCTIKVVTTLIPENSYQGPSHPVLTAFVLLLPHRGHLNTDGNETDLSM